MNTRSGLLLLLVSGSFLLTGCARTSSIDARKTKSGVPHQEQIAPTSQLTDQDVFGNELTLEITEEDIQNAVEEAQEQFTIPLNSAVVLIKSGSRAPDARMQQEMQRYYRVSTFSGIPVVKKKRPVQPVIPVKETQADTTTDGDFSVDRNSVVNANYMQAMRYIAAKGRQKAIVVYWNELEAGKYNSATKEVVWKKYAGEKLSGSSLRYLIRFALVDVATGEWATYSPANFESVTAPLIVQTDVKAKADAMTSEKTDITEQQIVSLEQKTCQMVVRDLVNRYSNKI
ncbi:hypothetical protein QBC30_004135 [Citrobacter freundii]|uniref:hypothetical protein n=1 Tax=Citrobacter freundii TaxID=546 RepID=UPI00131F9550|nr:hypothetical protein [Citrobacter freundii]EKV4073566.1 hypothetical protein [Citrobacter freundii]EKV5128201.1 hypothetical protein [Citrobacter freundii]EKW1513725.1 hypothetical protein [Citrobacter freundii]ELZ9358532.1 hypothetical protein [Citrobacter freundii]MBD5700234.1 hypothetical protein [Citrobacter freundii]